MKDAKKHIQLFRDYSRVPLADADKADAIANLLLLPWVQRLQIFSDQAIVLIDLYDGRYHYVSPGIKNITGFGPEDFTDFEFSASRMSPHELRVTLDVAERFTLALGELTFSSAEYFRLRSTRNTWFRRRDEREVNLLQHGIVHSLNDAGLPALQLIIVTDITHYNSNPDEHFFSLRLIGADEEADQIFLDGTIEDPLVVITPRERQILNMLAHGRTSESIAKLLAISVETVQAHRKNLMRKTGVTRSTDLIRHAFANGWI